MIETDLELLRKFAQDRSESAFAELVRRHLDLVYSAALRRVGTSALAQEVAQSVFVDLAQNACRLKPQSILTAWLYEVTRRTAIDVMRRESRRQLREQVAYELSAMNDIVADWSQLEPLLEEAMHTLDEKDRAAVLLRYFDNKNLREVGLALGVGEDAAQKRVSRAIERLRRYFSKHGVPVGASALVAVISSLAVRAAPIELAALISNTVGPVGISAATLSSTTKALAMSTAQKTIAALILASVVIPVLMRQHVQAKLRQQGEMLQRRADQLAQFEGINLKLSNQLVRIEDSPTFQRERWSELLRLRGQVGLLRKQVQESTGTPKSRDEVLQSMALHYVEQVNHFRQSLEQNPSEMIPELDFLTDSDWRDIVNKETMDDEDSFRHAASAARSWAENRLVNDFLHPALQQYAKENNGQQPADPAQLKRYFTSPINDAVLQRWEIVPAKDLAAYMADQALGPGDDRLIAPKAPVNPSLDMPTVCGLNKVTAFASRPGNQWVRLH